MAKVYSFWHEFVGNVWTLVTLHWNSVQCRSIAILQSRMIMNHLGIFFHCSVGKVEKI